MIEQEYINTDPYAPEVYVDDRGHLTVYYHPDSPEWQAIKKRRNKIKTGIGAGIAALGLGIYAWQRSKNQKDAKKRVRKLKKQQRVNPYSSPYTSRLGKSFDVYSADDLSLKSVEMEDPETKNMLYIGVGVVGLLLTITLIKLIK